MKRCLLVMLFGCMLSHASQAQLSLTRMVGKNANQYRLGYDLFSFLNFPLNYENQSLRIELMDLAFYPGKTGGSAFTTPNGAGYLSIKLGYKYIFSETKTGFYLEPAAGYCRVVYVQEGQDATYGDGVAGALEGGYSLEVGQKGHCFNLGLKYETDRGAHAQTISSVGLRLSFEFNLIGRSEE